MLFHPLPFDPAGTTGFPLKACGNDGLFKNNSLTKYTVIVGKNTSLRRNKMTAVIS